jgi:hypothetical protein
MAQAVELSSNSSPTKKRKKMILEYLERKDRRRRHVKRTQKPT